MGAMQPSTPGASLWNILLRESRIWATALRIPSLYLLLLALLLALMLIVHFPLSYTIDVGVEEGYGGDLPLLWNFNTFEDDEHGTYRWTRDGAAIRLPGIGHRPLVVRLNFIPISSHIADIGPQSIALSTDARHLTTLPVSEAGRRYALLIPPEYMRDGSLNLTLHTDTFTPPDDPRELGTPLDRVRLTSLDIPTLAQPAWGDVWRWMLVVLFFWLITMRVQYEGYAQSVAAHRTIWLSGGVVMLIALAAYLDPPRWGYGAQPALAAAVWTCGLVLLLRPALPIVAKQLHIPLNSRALGWLLFIVALAFGLRLGGRLYPLSMWGDIGFHTNRFIDSFGLGKIYLLSRNRGINFPYPPGTYLPLAPLILLYLDIRFVLPFFAALVDGISAIVMYGIVARALQHQKTALLAAAFYVFTAAGFMLTWWSFDTHIYSQAATLLLTATLLYQGSCTHHTRNTIGNAALLVLLLCGVFLGHFGFLINTVLMGSLLVVLIWLAAWWATPWLRDWARAWRWRLLLIYLVAGLLSLFLFYSAYMWLFTYQLNAMMHGGLTGLAERAPVSRLRLWDVLWNAGLIQHFGFFPLLLLPIGVWSIWKNAGRNRGRILLFILIVCSLLVSAVFAVLPFITLSTQSTRWLMFSAWAMATGAALAFQMIWRCGGAGRVVVAAMGGYVVWNSVYFWLAPMLWRIRPPEPF